MLRKVSSRKLWSRYIHASSFNTRLFNFNNANEVETTVYPAGFYRYNNNEWNLVKSVSGDEFHNKSVLNLLTAKDLGNIDENTAARHIHDNQYALDKFEGRAISYMNVDNYNIHGDVNIYPTDKQLYWNGYNDYNNIPSYNNSLLIPDMREFDIRYDEVSEEELYIAPVDNSNSN